MNLAWAGREFVGKTKIDGKLVDVGVAVSEWSAAKQNDVDKVDLGEVFACETEGGLDDAEEMLGEEGTVMQEAPGSHVHADQADRWMPPTHNHGWPAWWD